MLMAFVTSLEGQVQTSLTVFVTSSFQSHSLVSTIGVVQGVINGSLSPAPLMFATDPLGSIAFPSSDLARPFPCRD
jgi:hypothetical protein